MEESVFPEFKVRMLVALYELEDVDKQLSVFLECFGVANLMCILLNCPYCPKKHIWLLYLVDKAFEWLARHEVSDALCGSIHHEFEVVVLLNGKREAWEGDERIACTNLEPRIAGKQIALGVAYTNMELVSSINESVVEAVDRQAKSYFLIEEFLQRFRLYLVDAGRDDNLVAFLCLNLEISRNIEVFHSVISSFLFFLIYEALVPVWVKDKLILL